MAHPPTRFNLPADRVHLVLSLVADWQLEHILSTPLLPLFDPRSEDYNFRQRHLYEPFPHTPQYNEDDYVYEPGKIIHGEIRYGNGCINPLWPGYDYRHSWEIEMYRDLGQTVNKTALSIGTLPRIPTISELRAPYSDHTPIGFGHRFRRFFSGRDSGRPSLAVSTSCNPDACLLSLGHRLGCWRVESCVTRIWPGERDWEQIHRGSTKSEAQLVQEEHESRAERWKTWRGIGWEQKFTGDEQYLIKMQALHLMQQVYADVERNMKEGNGEGVEYMALYGNRRLVEPKALFGRKRKGLGLWAERAWNRIRRTVRGWIG